MEGARSTERIDEKPQSGRPKPSPPPGLRSQRPAPTPPANRIRHDGPFTSIDDFTRRTGLGQAVVKRLADADAFRSLDTNRRQALWQALGQEKRRRTMPLFDTAENIADPSWVGFPK
jgi:hypothetical protein